MARDFLPAALRIAVCSGILLVVLSGSGLAQFETTATLSCSPMRITISPGPGYEPIREVCGGDSDYIEIWAYDRWGYPATGIPWTDYWTEPCDESQELLLCMDGFIADSVTSSLPGFEGRTTISGPIKGGGCVLTGGLMIYVQGLPIFEPPEYNYPLCLDIALVSPDLNADGVVSLADFGIFCDSYGLCEGEPGYNGCCDYSDDGCCSLGDFYDFSMRYQASCM
jgi:hypothetical protein